MADKRPPEQQKGVEETVIRYTADLKTALYAHTQWDWGVGGVWGGLTRGDIEPLVLDIAQRAGLTAQEAWRTDIIFGEYIQMEDPDGKLHEPEIGVAPGEYAEDGDRRIEHVYILLNRFTGLVSGRNMGRDLHEREAQTNQQREFTQMGILDATTGEEPVECWFETPDEFVWWAISEEIRHAKQHFTHGTFHNWENAPRVRAQMLKAAGRKVRSVYDVMPDELDASQFAARMVAEILDQKGKPERAAYFRKIADEAKSRDLHITMEFKF